MARSRGSTSCLRLISSLSVSHCSVLARVDAKKVQPEDEPITVTRGFTVHRNVGNPKKHAGENSQEHHHKEKKHHAHEDAGDDEFGGGPAATGEVWEPERSRERERDGGEDGGHEGKDGLVLPEGVPGKKKERAVVVVGDGSLKGAFLGDVIDR